MVSTIQKTSKRPKMEEEFTSDEMPAVPSKESNMSVFDYFGNMYFFSTQDYLKSFDLLSEAMNYRNKSVYKFFSEAREEEIRGKLTVTMKYFVPRLGGSLDTQTRAMKAYDQWKEANPIELVDINDEMPKLPSKESNMSVFDYFGNMYFFSSQDYLMGFDLLSDAMNYRNKSVYEFFSEAREEEIRGKLTVTMKYFVPRLGGNLDTQARAMKAYDQWKEANPIDDLTTMMDPPRMVSVGFKIQNTTLSHTYDLECISKRVDELFNWWDENDVEKKLVGPYLCFVQSSGMGKTKLMYQYREQIKANKETDIAAYLILTTELTFDVDEEKNVFDFQINFEECFPETIADHTVENKEGAKRAASSVFAILEKTLSQEIGTGKRKKIVLLFDECQHLLDMKFGNDAFLFRCVRMWLREKRNERFVGVFTGTNSRLANFLVDTDYPFQSGKPSSREHEQIGKDYHSKGLAFNPPFFQTTTMGSCLSLVDENVECDYKRAVYYGRPLFALMAKDGVLDSNIFTALRRMLLLSKEVQVWTVHRTTWINILSTRVQLGQTSMKILSDLVAKAYANLSGYDEVSDTAQMVYLPDPVCARLAMCMMDEDFSCYLPTAAGADAVNVKGERKSWWTEKLKEIFSSGIVSPEKGDFGEVFVALYMLFCGDVLRKMVNVDPTQQAYVHFSVSLDDWLQLLYSGGDLSLLKASTTSEADDGSHVSVGFIQVSRNSLRSYEDSWKSLADESFLKHIYELGIGFYVFPGCTLIDMVIPLRVKMGNASDGACTKCSYVPLLVSIKCQASFRDNKAKKVCDKMKQKAEEDGLTRALCLLIIFASKSGSKQTPDLFDDDILRKASEEVSKNLINGVVAKAIRVPRPDVFGLSDAFQSMTPTALVKSELFSSHQFINAHTGDSGELKAENALRASSNAASIKEYEALERAMKKDGNDE